MNNWQNELLAEYDRQRILQEVEQIRLEKLAGKSHPRLFARIMVNFGGWMLLIGKQLRERYETPAVSRITRPRGTP